VLVDAVSLTKNPDRFGWLDAVPGGSGKTFKVDIRIAAEVPGTSVELRQNPCKSRNKVSER
jgi:hypothetical protein